MSCGHKLRCRWFVALLLVIPMIATAQNIEDRVIEHTLDNGLKLLMIVRHTSPTVAPYLIFKWALWMKQMTHEELHTCLSTCFSKALR
jgi:hypothetical protein